MVVEGDFAVRGGTRGVITVRSDGASR
jgi:hypothetical protein